MANPIIGFIGGGNMASSLVGGLLANGFSPSQLQVSDPLTENLTHFEEQDITVSTDNQLVATEASVLILAVKPQIMGKVASALAPHLVHNPLVISIAAGIPVAALQNWLGDTVPIVRCMPNTPALLQSGATGLFASELVSTRQHELASQILSAVGKVEWVNEERLIDAVTAVSGSGPAYYFLLMEMMEKVGAEMGLDQQTARNLTLQTALGAAQMALQSDVDVAELRRQVTSPAGTTEAAINRFLSDGLEQIVSNAMQDCQQRAEEMATEFASTDNR